MSSTMKVRFWGVRGSFPAPGASTLRFGGNTSCLQILAGREAVICDAGTGIRNLGMTFNHHPETIHLFLTHTHWDHIQGFPFFNPIYQRGKTLHVYGPRALDKSIRDALLQQMSHTYHPVSVAELNARISFRDMGEEALSVGDLQVRTKFMNHPITSVAYRFERAGRSVVYTGDHEPFSGKEGDRKTLKIVQFLQGANLLVADTTYTDEEYREKKGWGHSPLTYILELAAQAGVGKLALFHHEHTRSDRDLARIEKLARKKMRSLSPHIKVFVAREGQTVAV